METLKNMLEKLTKLSRECRYLEKRPVTDDTQKLLWKYREEMELINMFAHQLAQEICPDMKITCEFIDDVFQNITFTYRKYFLSSNAE